MRTVHCDNPSWQAIIAEMLALVGLGDRGSSKAGAFSLGMKQRLGLAAALQPRYHATVLLHGDGGIPDRLSESDYSALLAAQALNLPYNPSLSLALLLVFCAALLGGAIDRPFHARLRLRSRWSGLERR